MAMCDAVRFARTIEETSHRVGYSPPHDLDPAHLIFEDTFALDTARTGRL